MTTNTIQIIGCVGNGKSTFGNMLLLESNEKRLNPDNEVFKTGGSDRAVTKRPQESEMFAMEGN